MLQNANSAKLLMDDNSVLQNLENDPKNYFFVKLFQKHLALLIFKFKLVSPIIETAEKILIT
jgi:hypothetical protein